MTSSPASYLPRTKEYYDGFNDGYAVAKQEVQEFYDRMGLGKNTFTGTICALSNINGKGE